MKIKTKADERERIHLRQRKRIRGTAERPRLAVFRSVSHMYAQVIDDMAGRRWCRRHRRADPEGRLTGKTRAGNKAGAQAIGKVIAERLIEKGIKQRRVRSRRLSCITDASAR